MFWDELLDRLYYNWPVYVGAVIIAMMIAGYFRPGLRGKPKMPVELTPAQKAVAAAKRKAQKRSNRDKEQMAVADAIGEALDNVYYGHPEYVRKKYYTERIANAMGLKDLLPRPKKIPPWKQIRIPDWLRIQRLKELKDQLLARKGQMFGPDKPIPGPKPGEEVKTTRKSPTKLELLRAQRKSAEAA